MLQGVGSWALRTLGVAAVSGGAILTGINTFGGAGLAPDALKRVPGLEAQLYVRAHPTLAHDIMYAADLLCSDRPRALQHLAAAAAYLDEAMAAASRNNLVGMSRALQSLGPALDAMLSLTPDIICNVLPVHADAAAWKELREHHPDIDLIVRFGGTVRPLQAEHLNALLPLYETAQHLLSAAHIDGYLAFHEDMAAHIDTLARAS